MRGKPQPRRSPELSLAHGEQSKYDQLCQTTRNETPASALSEDRLVVEIEAWNWSLHLGLCSDLTPPDHRFQGGLNYIRGFDISGVVRAPSNLRSQAIYIWTSPFGPEMQFGPDDEVGQVYFRSRGAKRGELRATLLIPENAIATMATCLASVWKYLDIRTFDPEEERASIASFSFRSATGDSLRARLAAGDQAQ